MQSFTEGLTNTNQHEYNSDVYNQNSRVAKSSTFVLKPIDEMQLVSMPIPIGGVPPVDFDSSGVLVKRKIIKKKQTAQQQQRSAFMNTAQNISLGMHQPP